MRHLTWGEVSWRWRLTSWGWRWEYQSWLIQPLSQRVINYRYFLHQPTLLLSSARMKILESHSKNALILLPSLQFQMPCSIVKPNPNKPIVRSKCTIWPNLLNIPALPPTHWSYWWCSLVTVSLSLAALPERITPHHSPRKHEDPKYSFFCLHSIREPKNHQVEPLLSPGPSAVVQIHCLRLLLGEGFKLQDILGTLYKPVVTQSSWVLHSTLGPRVSSQPRYIRGNPWWQDGGACTLPNMGKP